jgi:hypothetical protein
MRIVTWKVIAPDDNMTRAWRCNLGYSSSYGDGSFGLEQMIQYAFRSRPVSTGLGSPLLP